MSSFLDRNDDAFIARVRVFNNVGRSLKRLSRARAWVFWLFIFITVLSLVNFILSCLGGKPDFAQWLSPFFDAGVFIVIDSQIKALKLAHQEETANEG